VASLASSTRLTANMYSEADTKRLQDELYSNAIIKDFFDILTALVPGQGAATMISNILWIMAVFAVLVFYVMIMYRYFIKP